VAINEIYTLLNSKDSDHVPFAPLLSLGLNLEVKTKYNNLFKAKKLALHEVTIVV
jgi:hypothetical protein